MHHRSDAGPVAAGRRPAGGRGPKHHSPDIVFPESSLQRGREYEIWFFQNILKRDFTKSIFTIPKLGASTRFNGCHNRTQPQTDGKKLIDDNDPNS